MLIIDRNYFNIMDSFVQKINELILENNNLINEKIIGIYYLEKLKYLVINELKNLDKSTLENLSSELENNNNQSKKFEFGNRPLMLSINYYKKSLSKIKSPCNYDILSIIVKGFKKVSIFDFDENKKSILLFISKNTGLVLSKNTITTENIASGSIILDIISEKNTLDIEK